MYKTTKYIIAFLALSFSLSLCSIEQQTSIYQSHQRFSTRLDSLPDTARWDITTIPGQNLIHSQFYHYGDSSTTTVTVYGSQFPPSFNIFDSLDQFMLTDTFDTYTYSRDTFKYHNLRFILNTSHDTVIVNGAVKLIDL